MTELYINMCKTATELQEAWKPAFGDRYFYKTLSEIYVVAYKENDNLITCFPDSPRTKYIPISDNLTWLPSAEQLMSLTMNNAQYKIIYYDDDNSSHNEINFLDNFSKWALAYSKDRKLSLLENLLLFFMRRCFYKYWDNDKHAWLDVINKTELVNELEMLKSKVR